MVGGVCARREKSWKENDSDPFIRIGSSGVRRRPHFSCCFASDTKHGRNNETESRDSTHYNESPIHYTEPAA